MSHDHPLGRWISATWMALGTVATLLTVAVVVAWQGFGIVPIAVRSGSMEPTIPVGSLVFVKHVEPSQVRIGDVITFDPPGDPKRTTHRVAQRELRGTRWYFRTKGDANTTIDDWRGGRAGERHVEPGITYGQRDAIRTQFHVPWLGFPSSYASLPHLREIVAALALLPIALWMLALIWEAPSPDRRSRRVLQLVDSGEPLEPSCWVDDEAA